ncbi:MAG: hypothetical protein WA116_00745 [Anaerolineaceae bacterium]
MEVELTAQRNQVQHSIKLIHFQSALSLSIPEMFSDSAGAIEFASYTASGLAWEVVMAWLP